MIEWVHKWYRLYLFWLVGIGQWYHHPDDVEVVEGSTGGERAGQDGCLAAGHLDTVLGHCHIQRPHTRCRKKEAGIRALFTIHNQIQGVNKRTEKEENTSKCGNYHLHSTDAPLYLFFYKPLHFVREATSSSLMSFYGLWLTYVSDIGNLWWVRDKQRHKDRERENLYK